MLCRNATAGLQGPLTVFCIASEMVSFKAITNLFFLHTVASRSQNIVSITTHYCYLLEVAPTIKGSLCREGCYRLQWFEAFISKNYMTLGKSLLAQCYCWTFASRKILTLTSFGKLSYICQVLVEKLKLG